MTPDDFLDTTYRQVSEDEHESVMRGQRVRRMSDKFDFAPSDPEMAAQIVYNLENEVPLDAPHLFVEDAAETVCPTVGYLIRSGS